MKFSFLKGTPLKIFNIKEIGGGFKAVKRIAAVLMVSVLLAGCGVPQKSTDKQNTEPKYKNTATAGVWISFSEINGMLKSEKGFKSEFTAVMENCKKFNITEIYVHVRAFCDSLYKSSYFPLFTAARETGFDILKYITEEAHKQGIKVHAWINPYRVSTSTNDVQKLEGESPAFKWLNDENEENNLNVLTTESGIYLNPAQNEVRELVLNGIKEILSNYEVDGIHFDDYFYPTTNAEFDAQSYQNYISAAENPLPLADWRRANVNALISSVYSAVKFNNKDTVFSISPAADIEKNYNEYYADIEGWVQNGYIDRVIPQIYFGFDYPDSRYSFKTLLNKWKRLSSYNREVELLIGLGSYKIGTEAVPDNEEWGKDTDIIARQTEMCYKDGDIAGFILFSYSSIVSENELNIKQMENFSKVSEGYSK